MLPFTVETVRLSLHLLAVAVWIGGQLVMASLVPVLRSVAPGAPAAAAKRFGQVAWAAFAVAVVTGVWNMLALPADQPDGYDATLGVKLLFVMLSGLAAAVHSRTSSAAVRGATGGLGLLASLAALVFGVML